ncbi:hypothetical protein IP87_15660 [beta proteobacterium AAP121]|nr:hypothetical protein IP80_14990 [beta proteobacterium AAP65]KPF95813.1 hypothetical protein IP87_15660 [beta proteobacterium AAP121]
MRFSIASTNSVIVGWYSLPSAASHQPRSITALWFAHALGAMPIRAHSKASSEGSDPHGVCSHDSDQSMYSQGRASALARAQVSDCFTRSRSNSNFQPFARVSGGYGAGFAWVSDWSMAITKYCPRRMPARPQ